MCLYLTYRMIEGRRICVRLPYRMREGLRMHVELTRWACEQVAKLERADPEGRSVARGVLLADVAEVPLLPTQQIG